ncbi:chromosome segregation protein SMC [Clostridium cellulovorans]|uniref:Chromosome partition protein Smc n=1 Tax=Clostridium cellulovorans (strain ATCC 35296 / DSM 3052 / OCM 3 / 743B) TaxID=573061 RepID=D9SLC7_CLOC7|nr:chromosome segregation protein SMC [Clostridium cellulovorans]ADL51643.1 chromosome segregation protein SMC [Clostridium cellulovorans 743B]
MYLKAIELRGFKSFADKTEIELKDGITAIVGPNGSGKSNISDAIRWVLGEQSVKNLRGGKMEDVIFAGTAYRKPVGLAQVALILDNSDHGLPLDYSQVTISRRLFRSGDSEYYINNTKCRLKDIHELFMDTGIGKEGYSIISQGKIEALLSGSSDERRELLEEAAGIVKYKSRKNESEKKLNLTEQNIVRLNDILSTYEERLGPLEIESEKAKEFLKLSESLKNNEISLMIDSVEKIQSKLEVNKEALKQQEEALKEIYEDKSKLKDEQNKLIELQEELEKEVFKEREEFQKQNESREEVRAENILLEERISNSNVIAEKEVVEVENLRKKITDMQAISTQHSLDIKATDEKLKELTSAIENTEQEVQSVNDSISIQEVNIDKAKVEASDLDVKIFDFTSEIAVINNEIENVKLKNQGILASMESNENTIAINTNTKLALLKETEELKKKSLELEDQSFESKKNLSRLSRNLTIEEKDLKELTNEKTKGETNLSFLNKLEEQYEGYTKSVKNLMSHIKENRIDNLQGEVNVLGEVISVNRKYETAIEIAVGSGISNIISSTEKDAKKLIMHLKNNNLGRATFLPLDTIRSNVISVDKNIANMKGYLGIASELIEYEARFKKAIDFVFGRTLIAEELDAATAIAKASNYSYRIVTLQGEVVSPGGSLSGGSLYSKSLNIIGRKREIEDISDKLKEISDKLEDKKIKIENLRKEIALSDEEILNLTDKIHFNNIEKTKVEERVSALEKEILNVKKVVSTNREIVSKLKTELEEKQSLLNDKNESVLRFKNRKEQLKVFIEEEESKKQQVSKSISERKDMLTSYKIEEAKTIEALSSKKSSFESLKYEIEEISERIKTKENEIILSKSAIEAMKEKIKNNNNILESINSYIISKNKFFEEIEGKKLGFRERQKKVNDQLEIINDTINSREELKHRQEVAIAKSETEYENILNKLNEEFNLTLAEAYEYKVENLEVASVKDIIYSLKRQISSLGVVNVGAIEEYKEIKEKYTFMNNQREDLINAKDELMKVIEEMTEKMKEVFNENFEKLKVLFNETFQQLFKGGSGDLLINGDDVLLSPIEINVQPPGKKLQNINLMSGGEKGLSAIALLFAILKMKPTPFCILDEIEAALDDVNVSRYAEFLKKFSSNTQFIVITHRKGTMEASDVLYGVTMEEKGVSKIVSVDLTNNNMEAV